VEDEEKKMGILYMYLTTSTSGQTEKKQGQSNEKIKKITNKKKNSVVRAFL